MGCGSSKPVADGSDESANFSGKGIDKFPDVPKAVDLGKASRSPTSLVSVR